MVPSTCRKQRSSWRNRLARSTVNREVVGSIPTEDALFLFSNYYFWLENYTFSRIQRILGRCIMLEKDEV